MHSSLPIGHAAQKKKWQLTVGGAMHHKQEKEVIDLKQHGTKTKEDKETIRKILALLRYETKFEDFLQNEVQDPMYYLVLAANNSLLLNIYEGIIILSAKSVSGYTIENKTYRAPSLALHYGTTLQRICDLTTHLLIKKCSEFVCNYEEKLNEIKRLRFLIETHWNNEVSSLALKDLEGKKWNKTCLEILSDDEDQKPDTRNEATASIKNMTKLGNVIMALLWNKVLNRFHSVSIFLQKVDVDLISANNMLISLVDFVQNLRNDLKIIENESKALSTHVQCW
ncbi:hypothetical protein PGB90_000937 [Kerria lacca]